MSRVRWWSGRLPCPRCGHRSYLFGCLCEATACICRKRRTYQA